MEVQYFLLSHNLSLIKKEFVFSNGNTRIGAVEYTKTRLERRPTLTAFLTMFLEENISFFLYNSY